MNVRILFFGGLLCLPAFMLTDHALLRLAVGSVYLGAYLSVGGRVRLLPILMLFVGVVAAGLMVPTGRILFRAGPIRVAAGSLRLSILRFSLIVGMIYLSRLSVHRSLRLPGRVGGFAGLVFYYLERLTERREPLRHAVRRGRDGTGGRRRVLDSWIDAVDGVLTEALYEDAEPKRERPEGPRGSKRKMLGYPGGIAVLAISWCACAVSMLGIVPELL